MEIWITTLIAITLLAATIIFFQRKLGQTLSLLEVECEYVRKDLYTEQRRRCEEQECAINELVTQKAILEERVTNEMAKLQEAKARYEQMDKNLLPQLEAMAGRITRMNTENFKKDSSQQLDQVLRPFEKTIQRIEQQIKETNESRIKDSTELRSELQKLGTLNHELQMEATNLTNALKLNPKQQGNWGEQILETLLEKAGLVKGIHYRREVTDHTDERKVRADVIIDLPEERHLVIDSKVSLNAYSDYCGADPEEAEVFLEQHRRSVKNHIDILAKKRYQDIHQINTPDMVFMFMPIEGSLIAALQDDQGLFQYAIERGVMLTTASTLFVSLRIVAELWLRNKQFENAEKIAEEAGKLHAQVLRFLQEMDNIEKGLATARDAYDTARKRLTSGNNNVLKLTTRIEDLGAKVKPESKGLVKKMAS